MDKFYNRRKQKCSDLSRVQIVILLLQRPRESFLNISRGANLLEFANNIQDKEMEMG